MEFPRLFPRQRISPVTATHCTCRCHTTAEEPAFLGNGCATPGVLRTDPTGAVASCARCTWGHCIALSGRPTELDAPLSGRRWNPPSLEAVTQADGGAVGEGPE